VDERLARLEQALEELRAENRELRRDLTELQERLTQTEMAATEAEADTAETAESAEATARQRAKGRWGYFALVSGLVAVPILAWTIWHANTFWSAVIGAVNALIVYFIGPGAVRLLAEGLLRAIPGVLLGQTARITVDSMRKKKAR
jgi:cation transport ATPase